MQTCAIDIGNSRIKGAFFDDTGIKKEFVFASPADIPEDFRVAVPAIVGSVGSADLPASLFEAEVITFDHRTPLPISINYRTPLTLGKDRMASVAGAFEEFPGRNVLVIDLGTCVNYDLIDSRGVFQGGVISPGLTMRYMAMSEHTAALPDISENYHRTAVRLPGKSTGECLRQGAESGLRMEIEGFISEFQKEYPRLVVILTGGDASLFESSLKAHTFAYPNIVLIGLNSILRHHVAS